MKPLTASQVENMITAAMQRGDWPAVDELAARLDQLTRPTAPPRIVDVALWYATVLGLHVFPLQPASKIPHLRTRGCKEATNDPGQIVDWWQRWPGSNVAIATGHLVDVIDIDGPIGVESWAKIENLPPILGVVSTPRAGGSHLYVAASGEGNAAGIFPGIDIRGVGGYVVAPPSINADGVVYGWRRPLQLSTEAVAA
jgi:hypothetical protein